MGIAKSIEPGQTAQHAQFDHSIIFSLLAHFLCINSLPNNKTLDVPKLKALVDDKLNVTENLKFALGGVENIVGKGENAGIFSFSHNVFKRLLFQGR